ncbi:transcription factor that binds to CRE motif [Elasticomyces elasticus]|nr:transcription factor that binds to CRE motif [Elasticomyces elasticus]KAK4966606.1 transcription factor that binds to CRE motif [Elasticomyces elasticus]
MESTTTSRYSPTIHIDNMSPQFLNPEDLHSAGSPTPAFDSDGQPSSATPKPVSVYSKPAKKRKSWGQSLPEPTTALPPRKRAKTDDEKEQRRIERIKRNRAAAHNSRERKRQETEGLAVSLARVQAELNAYRSLHGPLPAHIVLPEVNLVNTEPAGTPAPSDSHGTYDDPSPESPEEDDLDFSLDTIKEEPTDNTTVPYLPSPFTNLDAKPLLDPMHPAAMPDLQCRTRRRQASTPSTSPNSTTTSTNNNPVNTFWATLFLHLMTLQFQTTYRTLLIALWSLSPSRMARMMQRSPSTRISTSRLTTSLMAPLQLRSTALAQLSAATSGRPTSRLGALTTRALQRSAVEMDGQMRGRPAAVEGDREFQRQALVERERGLDGHDRDDDQGAEEKDGV